MKKKEYKRESPDLLPMNNAGLVHFTYKTVLPDRNFLILEGLHKRIKQYKKNTLGKFTKSTSQNKPRKSF